MGTSYGEMYLPEPAERFEHLMDDNVESLSIMNMGKKSPDGVTFVHQSNYGTDTAGDMQINSTGVFRYSGSEWNKVLSYNDIINLSTEDTWTYGEGIDNLGNIVVNTYWTMARIPVSENTEYSLTHSDNKWTAAEVGVLMYYNETTKISHVDMSTFSVSDNGRGKKFTTPATCTHVYINIEVNVADFRGDILVQGPRAEVSENGRRLIDKNVVFFGDSITANRDWWVTDMLRQTEFKSYLNYAISGATWSHTATTAYNTNPTGGPISPDNVIWNQINKYIAGGDSDPDIVVIMAGTNDYLRDKGSASVAFDGSPQTADPTDKLTVATAFRFCCELIKSTYPDARIIVTSPIPRAEATQPATEECRTVINDCALQMGIEFIDQYHNIGIYGYGESVSLHYLDADTVHPSEAGNTLIGEFMSRKLYNLIG